MLFTPPELAGRATRQWCSFPTAPVGLTIARGTGGNRRLMSRNAIRRAIAISAGVRAPSHGNTDSKCQVAKRRRLPLFVQREWFAALSSIRAAGCKNVIQPAHGGRTALENVGDQPRAPRARRERREIGYRTRISAPREILAPANQMEPPMHKTMRNVMPISARWSRHEHVQVPINDVARDVFAVSSSGQHFGLLPVWAPDADAGEGFLAPSRESVARDVPELFHVNYLFRSAAQPRRR